MIPLDTPPGTKVRVREDAKSHYNLLFLDGMVQYRGKVLTVKELKRNFRVEECDYYFHPSWLDLVEEPMTFPVGQFVRTPEGRIGKVLCLHSASNHVEIATAGRIRIFHADDLRPVPPFMVGDRVATKYNSNPVTITSMELVYGCVKHWFQRPGKNATWTYESELTPYIETEEPVSEPKRVQVVTETKTIDVRKVKFELTLPVSMLTAFIASQYCPTELYHELEAIADAEAGPR